MSTEYVHLLRVWSRRYSELLRFFKDILPRKQSKKLRRILRDVRKSANNARDLDVLIEKFGKHNISIEDRKFLHFLKQEREINQLPIQELYFSLDKSKVLHKQFNRIRQKVRSQKYEFKDDLETTFENLAKTNLHALSESFFNSMLLTHTKPKELHKTRIHGKRLRYALELSGPVLPNRSKK